MHSFRVLFGLLFCLVVGAPVAQAAEFACTDAVLWRNRVVVLKDDGSLAAWKMPSGDADLPMARELNVAELRHIAGEASFLWAATDTTIFRLGLADEHWTKIATYPKRDAQMLAIVVVGQSPLLVYPTTIVDPIAPREFPVPKSEGQVHTNVLRLLAIHGTSTMAWFGTGYGEWGGNLLGLDPTTGAWVQYPDSLHYVTGITSTNEKQVLVAWSMSHFMAHTMIRAHNGAAKPVQEWPELEYKYYQQIAYSGFDRALYGVENKSLVVIANGRPTEIAALPGQVFSEEPKAIGVAPGIRTLIPVAPSLVVVVPKVGNPLKVNIDRKLVTPLE